MICDFSGKACTFSPHAKRGSRAGRAIVRFSILFLFLTAALGLGLDVARLLYEKQRVQAAADAGAAGAVQGLRQSHDNLDDEIRPDAKNSIALHGFTDSNATVEVNMPPLSGEHASDSNYVEVYVTGLAPTYFMRIFGSAALTVRARAVSGLMPSGDPCIIALDPVAPDAFQHDGAPTLISDCGIMVNSNSAAAMRQVGEGCIAASWIGVAGGYSGNCIHPTPSSGTNAVIDPLLTLPVPDYGSMASGYTSPTGTPAVGAGGASAAEGGVERYWPGYYSNEVQIQEGTVVFEPGVYVLERGLEITGGTVTGSEVFFYNINSDGEQFIDVGGEATFRMTAPRSGPYKGMLFFNNRDAPNRGPGNRIARRNEDSYLMGALYFPSQHLDWTGNPENHAFWTMVVANTIRISGTADAMALNKPTQAQAPPTYRAVFWE